MPNLSLLFFNLTKSKRYKKKKKKSNFLILKIGGGHVGRCENTQVKVCYLQPFRLVKRESCCVMCPFTKRMGI